MKRLVLPLILLLFSVVPHLAAQTTSYTVTPSVTFNGNHLAGCPSQIASVNGKSTSPADGGVCFLATSSGGDSLNPASPYCSGPNGSTGLCFSAYLFDNASGGNYYTDGCVYNATTSTCEQLPAPVTTYCAPPTVSGQACGVGSKYTITFAYWFPQQSEPNPLSSVENAWIGSLTIDVVTNNFYKVCPFRQPCHWVANNVISGGSGSVGPIN